MSGSGRVVGSRRGAGVLLLAAVLLAGCRQPDPQEQLVEAARRTADSSFAYTVVFEGEETGTPDETAPGTGPPLTALRLAGRRVDGAAEIRVGVEDSDLLVVRTVPDGATYLQVTVAQLGALATGVFRDPEDVAARLRAQEVDPQVIEAVVEALAGGWVGLEGDPAAPPSPDSTCVELDAALGCDLGGFVRRYVIVGSAEGGDERTYEVEVEVQGLVEAIAAADPTDALTERLSTLTDDAPPRLPATVVTRGGLVSSIVIDLTELSDRPLRVLIELDEHGEVGPVGAPPDAVLLTRAQLLEASRALGGALPDPGDPAPSPAPTPRPPVGTSSPGG